MPRAKGYTQRTTISTREQLEQLQERYINCAREVGYYKNLVQRLHAKIDKLERELYGKPRQRYKPPIIEEDDDGTEWND